MKTGRNILISALLALGASGSILASAAVPAITAAGPAVVASGSHANPNSFYHG